MNFPRLFLAIFVGFVFVFGSDFVIHGVWMKPDYEATQSLWRTDAEMQARFPLMMGGQLLVVCTFTLIWAWALARGACLKKACLFGLTMGLFNQSTTLITYVVTPLPPDIAIKWFVSAMLQAVVLGAIVHGLYKPPLNIPDAA